MRESRHAQPPDSPPSQHHNGTVARTSRRTQFGLGRKRDSGAVAATSAESLPRSVDAVSPLKDVDAFAPENVGLLVQGRPAILALLLHTV